MNGYRLNEYSQNGEDGILSEIFRRLKIAKGKACEFGSADGYWLSNTRSLINQGWECVQLEASAGQFVTPDNVNELVPDELDLLSIDIDGNDFACWMAYTGSAKVVVIEINSGINPDVDLFTPDRGCNFSLMNRLAKAKGYDLLVHTGNCIYIQSEYIGLFPDRDLTFDKSFL
jgi:hypothetical protein